MDKFEALYVINKSAKKYNNMSGDMKKERSMALYNIKHRLINEWVDEFDHIEKHYIDNTEYLYFSKEDNGFHIPSRKFETDDIEVEKTEVLRNFSNDPINKSEYSERDALEYILEETGHNANHFLPRNAGLNAKWGYLF